MANPSLSAARTQGERSAATKLHLVEAAIASLMEHGYAYTTAVEVCQRAGLTRGAFHHHYASVAELLVHVLEHLYEQLRSGERDPAPESLEDFIRSSWARLGRVEFKAVIEIWLAARNDADLGVELAPAIARLSQLFTPTGNSRISKLVKADAKRAAFYRLIFETMIGLALGRATSPSDRPVAHEKEVIELLVTLSRNFERPAR